MPDKICRHSRKLHRHKQNKFPHRLAELNKAQIVNAGDGKNSHPSQAILDVMTIIEHKKNLSQLKVAIIGDVLHSRVANSLQAIFSLIGLGELILVAPTLWAPEKSHFGDISHSLIEGVKDADVIICLRVQKERLLENEQMDLEEYIKKYRLSEEILAYAKPDVMVMHPGPMNRGLEITSEIADGPHSHILSQVQNGVFARMAIIHYLLS
ncbi:aspartate carbamoyltransferase [Legionella adelaidensis]|uniref:aspartate carbamoyltransferase n=1 Tax=Legionella adelaidensis TaxID=45056 RepID=UPI00166288EF|nr:aspartate carbamoyltransferase [Legionella adelaidensis]